MIHCGILYCANYLEVYWSLLRLYNFNHTLVLAILSVLFRIWDDYLTSLIQEEFLAAGPHFLWVYHLYGTWLLCCMV
jgi:hypothetical protein